MPAPRNAFAAAGPGRWCTGCGGRPGISGPWWLCRICVCRSSRFPDHAIPLTTLPFNPERRALPYGTPLARERYRAAGLCVACGRRRDRADRLACKRCRQRLADASNRYRDRHPRAERQQHRDYLAARRARWRAAGLCPECGGDRDRTDRRLCARCRRRAADKQRAYRRRRGARLPLAPRRRAHLGTGIRQRSGGATMGNETG